MLKINYSNPEVNLTWNWCYFSLKIAMLWHGMKVIIQGLKSMIFNEKVKVIFYK